MSLGALIGWVRVHRSVAALYVAAIAGHLAVRGVYDPNNVDDPWTLSFIYSWLTNGATGDFTFGNAISNGDGGQSGLQFFGKVQALIYGPILSLLDWNRNAAHTISALFVAASMPMWWRIVGAIEPRASVRALFVACLIVSEPIVTASNEARPDALTFFLMTSSLLAVTLRHYFAAGAISVLAFEVHPMGAISVLYGSAIYLHEKNRALVSREHLRNLFHSAGGLVAGSLIYVVLHQDSIAELPALLFSSNGSSFGKSLTMYTFNSFAFRHLPEAILFAGSLLVFIRSGLWRRERGLTLLLGAAFVSLAVLRRGNHHYMLYYAPIVLLVGVVVVVHYRKQLPAAALFFVLMLGQYGVTAWRNSGFDINQYVRVMRQMVPAGSTPIVAEYNAWFSFYDRQFYGSYKYDDAFYYDREEFNALGLAQFTLVDRLDAPQGSSVGWREQVMPQGYGCEPRAFFSIQGRDYGAYSCARVLTP